MAFVILRFQPSTNFFRPQKVPLNYLLNVFNKFYTPSPVRIETYTDIEIFDPIRKSRSMEFNHLWI